MEGSKRCKDCHRTKPLDEFSKHSNMKDGYLNNCKECIAFKTRQRRKSDYVPKPAVVREEPTGSKKCSDCLIEKPYSEYPRNKGMKDGHLKQCKACVSLRRRANPRPPRTKAKVATTDPSVRYTMLSFNPTEIRNALTLIAQFAGVETEQSQMLISATVDRWSR